MSLRCWLRRGLAVVTFLAFSALFNMVAGFLTVGAEGLFVVVGGSVVVVDGCGRVGARVDGVGEGFCVGGGGALASLVGSHGRGVILVGGALDFGRPFVLNFVY